VLTQRSVVVVDTTEGQALAQAALNDFRKESALPVSYIVYTHFHGDHINRSLGPSVLPALDWWALRPPHFQQAFFLALILLALLGANLAGLLFHHGR
jgi:glyoxylase-like metal-dependent hydrolase (beta-lactamase superfamily II)